MENNNNDYSAPGCRTEHRLQEGVSVDALMIPFVPRRHATRDEMKIVCFYFSEKALGLYFCFF